ncbi:flagellar hook-length control protein FliK [Rhodanobacter sp. AS-Z3]|uniref:flagellar hook-length control protein FliK n=1 Tax=Rhodanobacter sp. AS-Z3 TaxID=3031330 RepID=UPI00247AB6B4|nr:flagellar hook-length control protein FliK [Rhodanobacter sp. AS-Z3]WEN14585.1 flagellar hook-length control protein FliK [Rhodanobacter sp. AS-Z3]
MNIPPISIAALTWAGAASGTTAQSWRIGTVLSARPLGVNPQGLLVLQVGAMTVEADVAHAQLPSQFQVRVLNMGAQPQLEILSQSPDPTFQRMLRERLPQQDSYAPLLATLSALAQRPALRQLPPDIRTALAVLEQALSTPAEVTRGEGLREAIRNSGMFFESGLLAPQGNGQPAAGADDWKGALLRLLGLLDKRVATAPRNPNAADSATDKGTTAPLHPDRDNVDPPLLQRGLQPQARLGLPQMADDDVTALLSRLHGDAKAALARVEVAQLDASAHPATAWIVEIPVRGEDGNDVLQVKLEHGADVVDGAPSWTMGFALDLPALGPVQGELQLREPRLSVRLWAERVDTAQRLEQQFTPLRQRLAACGVLLDQLSCQVGVPQTPGRSSALLLKAIA